MITYIFSDLRIYSIFYLLISCLFLLRFLFLCFNIFVFFVIWALYLVLSIFRHCI